MDTSQIYIEMCAKAEEIQNQRPFKGKKEYSRYYLDDYITVVPLYIPKTSWNYRTTAIWECFMKKYDIRCQYIWLPRQDQLQEMTGLPLWRLNFDYSKWLYDVDDNGFCDFHIKHDHLEFTSMEQLWLAFVMWELYKKRWGEIEWRGMQ